MAGESFTGSGSEWLDPLQVIVGGHYGNVPHIGGQQREFGLHISTLPIPTQQGIHGKGMTPIMDPWRPPLRGEDGALLEQRAETVCQACGAVSLSAINGVPDEGGI